MDRGSVNTANGREIGLSPLEKSVILFGSVFFTREGLKMAFNSVDFLIFFPIAVLVYYVLPQKIRNYWLLAASYYFYMCWNAKYALLLFFSTFVTYLSGLLIEGVRRKYPRRTGWAKAVVAGSFLINLFLLGYFKYAGFLLDNVQSVFRRLGIALSVPRVDVLLPVGISFFIFQALSYTMDVYREEVAAEHNLFRYALFVSFFPQLVAGPIERSKDLLPQFSEKHDFSLDRAKEGLLIMGWGLFLKMVIADRAAIFVDAVYNDIATYGGMYIVVAAILFVFQVYCDFSGYSCIALGAAQVLGFRLTENFEAPFCAVSVGEFWRRWHISLNRWFTQYLYIPLGGNRKGKLRKYCNQMVVFLVSGLWHGAVWSYVVWGGLNGIFVITGELTRPIRDRIKAAIHWRDEAVPVHVVRSVITTLLFAFSMIFFRSQGTSFAIRVIRQMVTVRNAGILFDGSLYTLGLNQRNFVLLLLALCVLMAADILRYRGVKVRGWILERCLPIRWACALVLILAIVVFGIWGVGYDKTAFIYFQF